MPSDHHFHAIIIALVHSPEPGGFKLWEGSVDLIRVLQEEIRQRRLSLRGKTVLEVSRGPLPEAQISHRHYDQGSRLSGSVVACPPIC